MVHYFHTGRFQKTYKEGHGFNSRRKQRFFLCSALVKAELTAFSNFFLWQILNDGMMKDLIEAASATQAEMEKQFDEERSQMKSTVEYMKTKIKEIEETEEKNGVKDGQLGETMSKIKDSIERFEKTNM